MDLRSLVATLAVLGTGTLAACDGGAKAGSADVIDAKAAHVAPDAKDVPAAKGEAKDKKAEMGCAPGGCAPGACAGAPKADDKAKPGLDSNLAAGTKADDKAPEPATPEPADDKS